MFAASVQACSVMYLARKHNKERLPMSIDSRSTMLCSDFRRRYAGARWRVLPMGIFAAATLSLSLGGCPLSQSPLDRDSTSLQQATAAFVQGRETFRFDTFGNETFWGDALQLHQAIAGAANGGVGGGLTPRAALDLGLKVDQAALPILTQLALRSNTVNLEDPAVTIDLLRAEAVGGVKGFFDGQGRLTSVGLRCALCHSTVDDAFSPGIGARLDGWANRDLNVGAIVALAPTLAPFVSVLQVDEATVRLS
jgi:hypothetical protein